MHRFLRSIGFSRLTDYDDEERLIQDVCAHSDFRDIVQLENGHRFGEFSKMFGRHTGITVCGIFDREERFHLEYYFPFCWGGAESRLESLAVDQHMRTFSFAAACEDMRIGTTIIFYLSNAADYLKQDPAPDFQESGVSVRLTGLAESGAILLPVAREQKLPTEDPAHIEQRTNLFRAAQNGDEEAIESLTIEDYNLYSTISRRAHHEDVYSIVDTYFIPYGMECDLYNVMGEIEQVQTYENSATKEKLLQLRIVSNDIPMDICINEKDLMGEPKEGRRFKGIVWLQGRVQMPGQTALR